MPDRIESNARTVMVLTAFSRITGLVRDGVLSRVLGANQLTSAFWFAFLVPNLFRRLFGEGALTAAFLPVYAKLRDRDPDRAAQLATMVIASLMIGLGGVVVLGEGILFLISAMRNHDDIAIQLMMITLPYMPLVCLVAILGAMLQVMGRFGPPAAAPILLNGAIIVAVTTMAWTTVDDERARLLSVVGAAVAMVAAGLLQAVWMLWSLRGRAGWNWNPESAMKPLKQVWRASLPMILGLGVLQLNTFFDGLIASYPAVMGTTDFLGATYPLDDGAMTIISYAQRLYQFPLGVFAISVATAIYPVLARQADDDVPFADTIRRGLRLVLFIGVPASVGLALVREPLAACILQGGEFTANDAHRVAAVLLGYATAVWAYSMNQVFTRSCYARMDMMTPVRIAMGVVVLNLVLNLGLIWTPLGETALAWSTAICAVLQCLLLLRATGRHVSRPVDATVRTTAGRVIGLSVVMGAAVLWSSTWFEPSPGILGSIVELAVMVVVGGGVYAAGARILRMPELRWSLGRP
ncbi:MAG: murein biosynthesis integral membrane protein MurJ [Planctomycetota bacterium]|nr:murein biosynthesis integral membrane protein MurJ [Planctomycetota bacterium]